MWHPLGPGRRGEGAREVSEKLIFRSEAAQIIGCTRETVTNLAKRGELRVAGTTPSGRRKYDPEDVRAVGRSWRARYGTPDWWKES